MPNFTSAVTRANNEKHGERPSILDWRAKADCLIYESGLSVSGTALTGPSSSFTESQVGQVVYIEDSGTAGTAPHVTTVAAFVSSAELTLTDSAPTATSDKNVRIGTNNLSAIQAAINNCGTACLRVPRGRYLISGALVLRHGLSMMGEGCHASPWNTSQVFSEIVSVDTQPILNWVGSPADSDYLHGLSLSDLNFRGVKYAGSSGISINIAWGPTLTRLSFHDFGWYAILIEAGIDGHMMRLWASDVWRDRTVSDYVGCFDIGLHDLKAMDLSATASIGYGTLSNSLIGNGNIAGVAIRGVNGYYSDIMGHVSQIGIYLHSTASLNHLYNCRADLNQGAGLVCKGAGNTFVGFRAHANSLDASGDYDGIWLDGAGNRFLGGQVSYNGSGSGPAFSQVRYGVRTEASISGAANHFLGLVVDDGSYTDGDFSFTDQTRQSVIGQTNLLLSGRRTAEIRGDLVLRDGGVSGDGALFLQHDEAQVDGGGSPVADTGLWMLRGNYGTGFAQLILAAVADDLSSEAPLLKLGRDVVSAALLQSYAEVNQFDEMVQIDGNSLAASDPALRVKVGDSGWVKIGEFGQTGCTLWVGTGTPESSAAAVGGSIALSGDGKIYAKASGTGTTGWKEVATTDLITSLPSQAGNSGKALKTNGSSVSWGRIDLGDSTNVDGSGFSAGTTFAVWDGTRLKTVVSGDSGALSALAALLKPHLLHTHNETGTVTGNPNGW